MIERSAGSQWPESEDRTVAFRGTAATAPTLSRPGGDPGSAGRPPQSTVVAVGVLIVVLVLAVAWLAVENRRLDDAQQDAEQRLATLEDTAGGLEETVTSLGEASDRVLDLSGIVATAAPSVFIVEDPAEIGTAFVVSGGSSGSQLLTNFHVVAAAWDGTREVVIRQDPGPSMTARVIQVDAGLDIALLEAPAELPALTLEARAVPPGEELVMLGSPFALGGTVSTAVSSGVSQVEGRRLLRYTGSTHPGSSGGPAVDAAGKVVAVSVGRFQGTETQGLAIPVEEVCLALPVCG